MHAEEISNLIQRKLPDSKVIIDGDGTHFTAIVITDAFIGKNRVQRQQMVYEGVREHLLSGALHALSIKTYTAQEWSSQKGS